MGLNNAVIQQLESQVGIIDQDIDMTLGALAEHRETIDILDATLEMLRKRRQEYIDALDLLDEMLGNKGR